MASTPTRGKVRPADAGFRRCTSLKVGHRSREAALDAADAQMAAGKVSPGCHLMPYLCDVCSEWHVRNHTIVPVANPFRSRRGQDEP